MLIVEVSKPNKDINMAFVAVRECFLFVIFETTSKKWILCYNKYQHS